MVGWVGPYFSSPGDTVTKDAVSQAFIHTKQPLNRTISNFLLEEDLQSHFVWSYFPFDLLCFADSLIDLWVRS